MLITLKEAADRLGVCRKTVYRRIKDGSLPVVKLSTRNFRIATADLEAFIESRKSN